MTDFEEAHVSAFKAVFVDANVARCWFLDAQAVIKNSAMQKFGIRGAYQIVLTWEIPSVAYLK